MFYMFVKYFSKMDWVQNKNSKINVHGMKYVKGAVVGEPLGEVRGLSVRCEEFFEKDHHF